MYKILRDYLNQQIEYVKINHRIDKVLKYYPFSILEFSEIDKLKKYFGSNIIYEISDTPSVVCENHLSILGEIIYNDIRHFNLSLGEFCKNYCSYCFYNKNDAYPTDENVELFLKMVKEDLNNIYAITIMGGEPTLYPNLNYIIKSLIDMNKNVFLLTSNMEYNNLYNIHIKYHIIKEILNNKIIFMNGSEMSFDEFKEFSMMNKNIFNKTQGVITTDNFAYVNELEEYVEFRIQTDRRGSYMINDEQIMMLPKSVLKREIIFYIQEVIKKSWITYNLSTNVCYINADRI